MPRSDDLRNEFAFHSQHLMQAGEAESAASRIVREQLRSRLAELGEEIRQLEARPLDIRLTGPVTERQSIPTQLFQLITSRTQTFLNWATWAMTAAPAPTSRARGRARSTAWMNRRASRIDPRADGPQNCGTPTQRSTPMHDPSPNPDNSGAALVHDREVLTDVLVYHWRRDDSGCGCGWGDRPEHLGRSWPKHVVNVYEDSLRVTHG